MTSQLTFELRRTKAQLSITKIPAQVWYLRNRKAQEGLPIHVRKRNRIALQVLANVSASVNVLHVSAKWVKKRLKTGSCYGQTRLLRRLVMEGMTPEAALVAMHEQQPEIVRLQILEVLRAEAEGRLLHQTMNDSDWNTFVDATEGALERDPDRTFVEAESVPNALLGDQLRTIRLHSTKRSTGHAILFSNRQNQFWFYNSQHAGLFRYESSADLVEALLSHVRAYHPWALKSSGSWIFENN